MPPKEPRRYKPKQIDRARERRGLVQLPLFEEEPMTTTAWQSPQEKAARTLADANTFILVAVRKQIEERLGTGVDLSVEEAGDPKQRHLVASLRDGGRCVIYLHIDQVWLAPVDTE
jgi:hypothetical protein